MKRSLLIIFLSLFLILSSCTIEDFTKSPSEREENNEQEQEEIVETTSNDYWGVIIGYTNPDKLYSNTKYAFQENIEIKTVTKGEDVTFYCGFSEEPNLQNIRLYESKDVPLGVIKDIVTTYNPSTSHIDVEQTMSYDTTIGFDFNRLADTQGYYFNIYDHFIAVYLLSSDEIVIVEEILDCYLNITEKIIYYFFTDQVAFPINYQDSNVYNPVLSACYGEEVTVLYPYAENSELSININNQITRVTEVVTIDNVDYYQYKFEMPIGSVDISFTLLFIAIPINPPVCYKPVIYLYPEVEMDITVKYDDATKLLTTYPKYQDGWSMHVLPNSVMYDEAGRSYYALYFEEIRRWDCDFSVGFLVKDSDALAFLEEKLAILGFNERESNEFIMYWLSTLENNEYSLVYFEQTALRNANVPLDLSVEPDSMLRVIMHIKAANGDEEIEEEQLLPFERTGFTIVEWGGTIY